MKRKPLIKKDQNGKWAVHAVRCTPFDNIDDFQKAFAFVERLNAK